MLLSAVVKNSFAQTKSMQSPKVKASRILCFNCPTNQKVNSNHWAIHASIHLFTFVSLSACLSVCLFIRKWAYGWAWLAGVAFWAGNGRFFAQSHRIFQMLVNKLCFSLNRVKIFCYLLIELNCNFYFNMSAILSLTSPDQYRLCNQLKTYKMTNLFNIFLSKVTNYCENLIKTLRTLFCKQWRPCYLAETKV